LRGSISVYQLDGTRSHQLAAIENATDLAYANGALVVLTPEGLLVADPSRPAGVLDRLPTSEPVRLVGRPADGTCLVVNQSGQSWRIDRQGTYPPDVTLPSGDSVMTSADLRRCTVAVEGGGHAYYREGARVRAWPEATSAAISADGQRIVVTLPGTLEVWEDKG
jgi:hypothetical protein